MKCFLLLLFLAFTLIASIKAQTPKCSSPKEHYSCGTACQKSCESIKRGPGVCTTECKKGCFCNRGYVRATDDESSECIKEECCDNPNCSQIPDQPKAKIPAQTCPSPNEHWRCGTACQKSCESVKREPGMCTTQCKYGCFCNKGYIRKTDDDSSECVKKECCDNPNCSHTPDQM